MTFFGHILDIKVRIKYFFLVRIPVLYAESVGSDIIYNIFKFLEILDIGRLSKWPPKYPEIGKKITIFDIV